MHALSEWCKYSHCCPVKKIEKGVRCLSLVVCGKIAVVETAISQNKKDRHEAS